MRKNCVLFVFFILITGSTIAQENIVIKKAVEDIAIEDNLDDKLHDLNKIDGVHKLYFDFYLLELEYGTILRKTINDINVSNNDYFINQIFDYYNRFNNNLNPEFKDKFLLYDGTILCSDNGVTNVTLYFVDENNYGFEVSWTRATNGITYTYNSDNYKKEKIVFKSDLKKIKNARRNLKKSKNK